MKKNKGIEDLLKKDILALPEASSLRIAIVKDRQYDIPEWFHRYITKQDLNVLWLSLIGSEYAKLTKEMIQFVDTQYAIHPKEFDYKYIGERMGSCGDFKLLCYMDYNAILKVISRNLKRVHEDSIVQCINRIYSKYNSGAIEYIKLYFRKTVSRFWKRRKNKSKTSSQLTELFHAVNPKYTDNLYNDLTRYNDLIDLSEYELPYIRYLTEFGGTSYKYGSSVNDINLYMENYINADDAVRHYEYPMDSLARHVMVSKIVYGEVTENYHLLSYKVKALQSLVRHPDNIVFIADLMESIKFTDEERNDIAHIIMTHSKICTALDACYKVCPYSKFMKILMRYMGYPECDMNKVLPYIIHITDSTYIMETMDSIDINNLTWLLNRNPIVHRNGNNSITFRDIIHANFNRLTATLDYKIREACVKDLDLLKSLTYAERSTIFGNGNLSLVNLCAKYPQLAGCMNDITFSTVIAIYKQNPEVIHYAPPNTISEDLIVNHIKTNGYTKLNKIHEYGLENIISIDAMVKLTMNGIGLGHILDLGSMIYKNAFLTLYITQMIENSENVE